MKSYYMLEGIDGSGKTTIAAELSKRLAAVQQSHILITREPGGCGRNEEPVLTQIRSIVKSGLKIDPLCELMLFMADRAQHREMVVKPAIKAGDIIIQDRGFISSLAYQHYGRGRPLDLIEQLNDLTMSDVKPNQIYWIDTPLDVALKRTAHRTDSFEAEEFQRRVYDGYFRIHTSNKYPMIRIDGSKTIDKICDDILNYIQRDMLSRTKLDG